jgi:predicted Zn-dependent peptidase
MTSITRNAYTSDLSMVYEADCADFEWDRILDLQKLAICQPKFNEDEMVIDAIESDIKASLELLDENDNDMVICVKQKDDD